MVKCSSLSEKKTDRSVRNSKSVKSSSESCLDVKVAMSPMTSVFVCPLVDDVPYDDSVRINLDNQALLRSGWCSPSNSTTSC
jgi:hypothetical protein